MALAKPVEKKQETAKWKLTRANLVHHVKYNVFQAALQGTKKLRKRRQSRRCVFHNNDTSC